MGRGRGAKRTDGTGYTSTAKKAKTVDPVQEKIEKLFEVFEDEDQVGVVGLSDSAKAMLQSVIPSTLAVPSNQRHTYQAQMVDSVGDVLKEVVQSWEAKITEAESSITCGESTKDEIATKIEASESALEAKRLEETQAQESLEAAEKDAAEALRKSTEVHDEVVIFDVDLARKEKDREQMKNLLETNFATLKSGEVKGAVQVKKLMAPITAMMEQLKADEVLMAAIALTFPKKLEARGPFANLAVDELEKIMHKNLEELDEHIANANVTKAEKSAAAAEAKTEAEAAKVYKECCCDALTAAVDARQIQDAELKELKKDMKDHGKKMGQLAVQRSQHESQLASAKDNLAMFDFLRELVEEETKSENGDEENTADTVQNTADAMEDVEASEGPAKMAVDKDAPALPMDLSIPSPVKTRQEVIA